MHNMQVFSMLFKIWMYIKYVINNHILWVPLQLYKIFIEKVKKLVNYSYRALNLINANNKNNVILKYHLVNGSVHF